jgi:acyl transferase domain-containing protein
MNLMIENKTISSYTGLEIAVVGMSGRFPGAENIHEFWDNLKNGKESITFFSDKELIDDGVDADLLKNPNYVKAKGLITNPDYFDASFFEYTPSDVKVMDPQIKVFHECVWEALEDAGYDPYRYKGSIGLFAGAPSNTMWEVINTMYSNLNDPVDSFNNYQYMQKDFLTTLISYKLNLKGPSVSIQTACSTSLVALHTACRELLMGGCNIVVAGGISISYPYKRGYIYQEDMIMSPDGHCRTFDVLSKGTVMGDGAGAVVLKKLSNALEDNDHIYAIIKGSRINNDGARKVGYNAPSVDGQSQVIKSVYHMAGVDPGTIGYIEAHGTATALGDPIEVDALTKAFNISNKKNCAIGSVKTNIGHLDAAAGIAGFIKTVLAIKNKQIPPSLHFESANPKIDFEDSPFYVSQKLHDWPKKDGPIRAGISSFGIGGTNAHVILEESPEKQDETSNRKIHLLLFSAKTPTALDKLSVNLANYLEKKPETNLADLSYTLQIGRSQFEYRKTLVCSNIIEVIEQLKIQKPPILSESCQKRIVFMFPGQGSQYVNMGRDLYENEEYFQNEVNKCLEITDNLLPFKLKDILYPENGEESDYKITDTIVTQPVLFIFEYSLAKLLMKWGINPDAMIGHSIGEYVAACISGVFSLEDALSIIVFRGKIMQEMPDGSMLSVMLSEEDVLPFLNDDVSLAVINSSSLCVLSGSNEAITKTQKQLKEAGYPSELLPVLNVFHSDSIGSSLEKFSKEIKKIRLNKPQIPYISNLTGKWITIQDAANPEYWTSHLTGTVRFSDGLSELLAYEKSIFIEIGPGQNLSTFVKQHKDFKEQPAFNLIKHSQESLPNQSFQKFIPDIINQTQEQINDQVFLFSQLGRIWCCGININWNELYKNEKRKRISLPTYPFERQNYSILVKPDEILKEISLNKFNFKRKEIDEWFYLPSWKRKKIIIHNKIKKDKNCLLFINDNQLSISFCKYLKNEFQNVILIKNGQTFTNLEENIYSINAENKNDYLLLFNELKEKEFIPDIIGHLWNILDYKSETICVQSFKERQTIGFYCLLYLSQAIAEYNYYHKIEIIILSNNLYEVNGGDIIDPAKSTVLGPCLVIPQENMNIRCRSIDLKLPEIGSMEEKDLIKYLSEEFLTDFSDTFIAYRNNYRWIKYFEQIHKNDWAQWKDEEQKNTLNLKNNGVYLITGGLGKIGLTFTKCLIESVNAKVILITHSFFPPEEEWEEWLNTNEEENKISIRIRILKEIKLLSNNILIYKSDLSNIDEIEKIISEAEDKFGKLNGVIHAAGVTKSHFITEVDYSICEMHFMPKVYGLLNLTKVFNNKELDFCIMMSSLSSLLGGIGLVAYSASNIFMDFFINQYPKHNCKWISVNWNEWDLFDGSTNKKTIRKDILNSLMGPSEGFEAFLRIISLSDVNQIVVSTSSLDERFKKWVKFEEVDKSKSSTSEQILLTRPNLSTSYVSPQNELEGKLAAIWQEVLGIKQIGIDDNFFEIGGHSLNLIKIQNKIKEEIHIESAKKISLMILFQHHTIKSLANFLVQGKKEIEEKDEKIKKSLDDNKKELLNTLDIFNKRK